MHDAAGTRGSWRPGRHHWPFRCAQCVTVSWLAISTAQQGPPSCCLVVRRDGHSLPDQTSEAQHAGDIGNDSTRKERCR